MSITIEKIEAAAPDQASLSSAAKIKRAAWLTLAREGDFIWGECQGSGATPYRACAQISDAGSKCSCPSRKFPCKHALSLMLVYTKAASDFSPAATPDWVRDWSARRRSGASPVQAKSAAQDGPSKNLEAALAPEPEQARDERALARAAEQRDRLKAQREAAIAQGLDELDLWIGDLLNQGLSNFAVNASASCRRMAQRMVDAKAPGLANTLDGLPARLVAQPEAARGAALIEELGALHLLAAAYRRQEALAADLREDVRRLVGWSVERQTLLEDASTPRLAANWIVTGAVDEIQPDKLKRWETWLAARVDGRVRNAVLLDFAPASQAVGGPGYAPGEALPAELAFYPSAAPLRAIVERRLDAAPPRHDVLVGSSLEEALAEYDATRARLPWPGRRPLTLAAPRCVDYGEDGLWIVEGARAIPVSPDRSDEARALTGVEIELLCGLWDGRIFAPTYARTSLGGWTTA